MKFEIKKKISNKLARAGIIKTEHGDIETPAFISVGTKATVKSLTPEQIKEIGAQAVLANTYHLYLQPGHKLIERAGGFAKFMNWDGPTMTDSGGFQAFSLGVAYGTGISKLSEGQNQIEKKSADNIVKLAKVDEDGVTFKSIIDGSEHKFTPERSMDIQYSLGADIIFAFDECTSPTADYQYQKEAIDRTYRWAKRSLSQHIKNQKKGKCKQALFGIVQGGRFQDLRLESAREISSLSFDGFGIGGSFDKKDLGTAVKWVNDILPENKPRHLLGIGEPLDIFEAVENGCDTFDCVSPTRQARNGTLYTEKGKINIKNAQFRKDFSSIDKNCRCYTCQNYTRAYVSHLFRANEILANTLATIHNLYFVINLTKKIRESIIDGTFLKFKKSFYLKYKK